MAGAFKSRGKGLVAFQLYDPGMRDHHFIIQLVAVPFEAVTQEEGKQQMLPITDFVMKKARDAGLEVHEGGLDSLKEGEPYFCLTAFGNGQELVLVPGPDARVNLRFGSYVNYLSPNTLCSSPVTRSVVAEFLGSPERANWKKFVLTRKQEELDVEMWRGLIKLD